MSDNDYAIQHDREVAYEQNVTGLEIAWHDRIERFARDAVNEMKPRYGSEEYHRGYDRDGLQIEAGEIVTARLLDSERWANVKAADISDIAYEAVGRVIDSQ